MQLPSFVPASRGARGLLARSVQELLYHHDFHVEIDSDFGEVTERKLIEFQITKGLAPTGIVDEPTFDALIKPISRATAPIAPHGRSLGEMVVAYAHQHLAEKPCEAIQDNTGPWVRLYMDGIDGSAQYWCAGFACSMYEQACETLGIQMPFPRTVSCDELAGNAKERGLFVSEPERQEGRAIPPGSLFLSRDSPTDWTHTGVVIGIDNAVVVSIDGNTNGQGGRNGGSVLKKSRNLLNKDFILPERR